MPKFPDKPEKISVRTSPDQIKAITEACENYRRKTGKNITQAEITRQGWAKFCADNNVAWPQESGR